jgi:hypothetical protein
MSGTQAKQSVDYNIDDIRRTFLLMRRQPDQVTELRCLRTRWKTLSAYSNNIDKLVELAVVLSQRTPHVSAVYLTANPCLPSLLALYPDQIKEYADKTTPDGGIIRRCWLLIDIDPNPTAGISSTDKEHAAAQEKAKSIARFLVDHGVPANSIILGDSGNGAHVLVAIDLPKR